MTNQQADFPFCTIESAHEYMTLLAETILEAMTDIEGQIDRAESNSSRYRDALRVGLHNLQQLKQHVRVSRRLLNNLRTLRRLIYQERADITKSKPAGATVRMMPAVDSHNRSSKSADEMPNVA